MSTALVTGATSGIGLGFAERLASDGYDLVLVARNRERLDSVAQRIATGGVNVEALPADLGVPGQLREVAARLRDDRRPVDLLVNNAGFSANQKFVGGDVEAEQAQIDVMVSAVMRLSDAALPGMVRRERGAVINVSSIASFLPFGTYSAAKAWVTSFTQGLATELHGTGVRALAVCPGFVRTEFHERAGIDIDRSSDTWWREVDAVVQRAMEDLRRGKVISVEGRGYRAIAAGTHLLPRDALRRAEGFRRSRVGGRRQD